MSASVNKWIGIGTLGRDPETRFTQDGSAITNFSIACNRTWKDKNGEKQEEVEWVRITTFGRTAEVAGEYLKKGHPVFIEGRLRTRKWQDKDGNDRYTTEVVAENVQFLARKEDGGQERPRKPNSSEPRAPKHESAAFDDDVPF